jgi:hypothetical protein
MNKEIQRINHTIFLKLEQQTAEAAGEAGCLQKAGEAEPRFVPRECEQPQKQSYVAAYHIAPFS